MLLTQKQRYIILFIFIVSLYLVFEYFGIREQLGLDYLRRKIHGNLYTGILIFILLFCIANLIQLPGMIFLAAAVLTIGKVWGGVLFYTAAVTSCIVTYIVIGSIGGDGLRHIKSERVQRIFSRVDTHPIRSIFLLRLLFQTAPPMNFALALSGIQLRHYALGTIAGLPLPIAVYCLFFDYIAKTVFKII